MPSGQQCGKHFPRSKTKQKTLRPYLRNEGGKRLRHPCRQHPKAGTRKNRVSQHRSTTTLFAMTNPFMMEKVLLHIPLFHSERKPPALLNNRSRTTTRHKTLVTNLRRGCILTKCILMRKPFRNWSEMSPCAGFGTAMRQTAHKKYGKVVSTRKVRCHPSRSVSPIP